VAKQVSLANNDEGIHPHQQFRDNEQICMLILYNRIMTINEVENQLQINHSSAYKIICEKLHFRTAYARMGSERTHGTE
jgi:hypothetical protein